MQEVRRERGLQRRHPGRRAGLGARLGAVRAQARPEGAPNILVVLYDDNDSADTVSRQYTNPFPITGGKLLGVAVDVSGQQYLDLELEAAAMLSRE